MKRAIVYARVSTGEQVSEGVSLDAQRARAAAWCQANDYDLADADVFVDAGLSGKRADNRPALLAAIKAACDGGDVLVVYSLSRLARSTKDAIMIGDRLRKASVDLVSITEAIDTTSAAGKMVYRMLAVLAEFERDIIGERTKAACAYKRSQGEKTGGNVPYGFGVKTVERRGRAVKVLVPDAQQQAGIALACRLRTDGCTFRAVAEQLHKRGHRPQNGRQWDLGLLRRIILRTQQAQGAAAG